MVGILSILAVASCSRQVPSATEPPSEATSTAVPIGVEPQASVAPDAVDHGAEIDGLFAYIGGDEPGAAVAVVSKGEIVYEKGYGVANVETGAAITPATMFHMASAGKQFTAMGIMLLYADGDLDYDAPVGTYLPELAPLGDGVTVRRLLQHISGLPGHDLNDGDVYDTLAELPAATNTDELALLAKWSRTDLPYEPAARFDYSNPGYDVLGSVIERLSGQAFGDFMQERIFGPLGMENTFSLPNAAGLALPDRARGYDAEDGVFTVNDSHPLDALVGSGSIYSTVEDLYLYDQALYTDDLVKQETLQAAFEPAQLSDGTTEPYGFGWELGDTGGSPYVAHDGVWEGYVSYILRYPQDNWSVFVLSNRSDMDTEGLAFEIAGLYE